eukprot:TRINITY_DN77715_c0_g1_i1.p1 TRINITY_DN77715_c0_g1~~TRINITY_DN77715_c0_g1_i1.p1  ORF type:complete len:177 (-),score=36.62 TRINITY_DN77715_c0_g1_i1:32-562(-)
MSCGMLKVTFGDGFELPDAERCSSFERHVPGSASLRELKVILAAWAGFGNHCDCFELAAPFSGRPGEDELEWCCTFGQRSRPLPAISQNSPLTELVSLMISDRGFAGVGSDRLAVFAFKPCCPKCGARGPTFGRSGATLREFGGDCEFEDGDGKVIYQLGCRAQCGNCWIAERKAL